MNKVGILTFHAPYNNGSALQAYALQNTISSLGHDCEIINFRHPMQDHMGRVINTKIKSAGAMAKNLQNVFYVSPIKQRNALFLSFIREHLKTNSENFLCEEEVEKACKKYNTVVCGSDQIWSLSDQTYDRSLVYFLNFPHPYKTVAYAPSFGNDTCTANEKKNQIFSLVKEFDHVSMREKDAVTFLKRGGIDAKLVLDPTLILDRDRWAQITAPKMSDEPYILYYSINSHKFSVEATKKIAAKTGLKVISPVLHPRSAGSGFEKCVACGPMEFLSLVKNAEFVCTNSFHGTCFSVIFGKPFVAIFDTENGKIKRENRKASLLEQLGLEKNMITAQTDVDIDEIKKTDFCKVHEKLDLLRSDSIGFLQESL